MGVCGWTFHCTNTFKQPWLGNKVISICEEVGLPDACRMDVSKEEAKEVIRLDRVMKLKVEMSGGKKKLE